MVLFSGGRDSTLAALRLNRVGTRLSLVTATSDHLVGVEAVHQRLRELARLLPSDTEWFRVRQPRTALAEAFSAPTCLPCHAAYAAIGVAYGTKLKADSLTFGYAGYQADWPEQTKSAVDALRHVLTDFGFALEVPAYDIARKEDAIAELGAAGIETKALEQKCLQQQFNVALDQAQLVGEVQLWTRAIRATTEATLQASPDLLDRRSLGDFL